MTATQPQTPGLPNGTILIGKIKYTKDKMEEFYVTILIVEKIRNVLRSRKSKNLKKLEDYYIFHFQPHVADWRVPVVQDNFDFVFHHDVFLELIDYDGVDAHEAYSLLLFEVATLAGWRVTITRIGSRVILPSGPYKGKYKAQEHEDRNNPDTENGRKHALRKQRLQEKANLMSITEANEAASKLNTAAERLEAANEAAKVLAAERKADTDGLRAQNEVKNAAAAKLEAPATQSMEMQQLVMSSG